MALPRLLRRSVELGGEVLEEFDPVAVALLSLLFAEPDDHQILLRSDVDVLPVLAARRGCCKPHLTSVAARCIPGTKRGASPASLPTKKTSASTKRRRALRS